MHTVFLSVEGDGFPHLGKFVEANPTKSFDLWKYPPEETNEKRYTEWRNCDRNIRNYYKEIGQYTSQTDFLFLEWDVLVNVDLFEKFDKTPVNGIEGRYILSYKTNKDWHWFQEIDRFPSKFEDHFIGVVPLGVIRMSKNLLDEIIKPEHDYLYEQDIFCELRTPTLAKYLGFDIKGNDSLEKVHWQPIEYGGEKEIYHSIKKFIG